MARWKSVLVDVVCAAALVGITVLCVRMWRQRQTAMGWPVVAATVTVVEQGPGFKGRSSTYLRGDYQTDVGRHPFSVVWGPSDLDNRAWVPPAGTPTVGSSIRIHANPSNPSQVALEKSPSIGSTAWRVFQLVLVVGALVAVGIVVWFI